MHSFVTLKKNGVLTFSRWDREAGGLNTVDVSDRPESFLFYQCILDSDVTLRDLFMLVRSNMKRLLPIVGNWCDEIVEEGLREREDKPKETEVEYLEVYWHLTIDEEWKDDERTGKMELSGFRFPNFHGVGFDSETGRTNYSLSFSDTSDFIDIPLRLGNELTIEDEIKAHEMIVNKTGDYNSAFSKHNTNEFSLGHVIYGIFWELSFFGSPASRKAEKEELMNRVDEIESGDVSLVDWDEIFGEDEKEV